MSASVAWTLELGVNFVRDLNVATELVGFHCALCGSVLHKGESSKDLDLVIFPMSTAKVDLEALQQCLKDQGLKLKFSRAFIASIWERKGRLDQKNVDAWELPDGRRVDIFHLR